MKIIESKTVDINSIKPNLYNPNSMRDNVYKFLKKSINKRGFVQPIVINKNGIIIDGEHRWKALKELGATEVEVKVLDITDEECKAETINFNLTKGTFDVEQLGQILLELDKAWGKETLKENLVMEQKQIDAAIRASQKSIDDQPRENYEMPSETKHTNVHSGDLYSIGNHILMCGDSTDKGQVEELTCGKHINFSINDPPYNVNYKYNDNADNMGEDEYERFIKSFVENALSVSPFVAVTPGNRNEKFYYKNFEILGTAYWYKGFALTNGVISRAMVTEPVLFIGKKPVGKMLDTDHLDYHTDREIGLLDAHSCPKPVALFKEIINTFTDLDGSVLDLFGGSGTTMVACEALGRTAYVMEKDPVYCQNIINRMKSYGLEAEKL